MDIKNRILGDVYFTTDTVVDWIDIFTRPRYRYEIIDSLKFCQKNKGLVIYAWVLMSNHLHMIVSSESDKQVSDIMRDFKKFTSKEIIKTLHEDLQESRKEWILNRFAYAGKIEKKIKSFKFWQEGNCSQGIYLEQYFQQKLDYIHNNPVKAEIVNDADDYKFSSAIDYAGRRANKANYYESFVVQ